MAQDPWKQLKAFRSTDLQKEKAMNKLEEEGRATKKTEFGDFVMERDSRVRVFVT